MCLQRLLSVENEISERFRPRYPAVPSSTPEHGGNRSPPSTTSSHMQPNGPIRGQHRKRPQATNITATCAKQGRTRERILGELMAVRRVTAVLNEHGYAAPSAVVQRQHDPSQSTSTATSPASEWRNGQELSEILRPVYTSCLPSIVAFCLCVPFSIMAYVVSGRMVVHFLLVKKYNIME